MTIYWLRHGETALNAARVLQPEETPLSARGRLQARAAARRLAGMKPAALLSSDLPRARETAEAVAAATGLPLRLEPLLRERNFGALRGLAYDTLEFDPLAMHAAPPDGESRAEFLERVARAWAAVAAARAACGGTLLVVSHGLLIHAALDAHAGWHDGLTLPHRLANTSVSAVDAEPPHRVRLVDDTSHLTGVLGDDVQALSGG
ncbi:MAG: histidine phosphatase family protein [Rubrivivax sp.]